MSERDDQDPAPEGDEWRSYRCPVCGHADEVAPPGEEPILIRCSHCDTPLEVQQAPGGTERVSVQVAGDEA